MNSSINCNAIVLLPVHKVVPTDYELVSLTQCLKILAKHELRLLCPQSLDTREYQRHVPHLLIDRFDDHWFTSVQRYNDLKRSLFFYLRYRNYRYMLTYELDSFVFRDDLDYWCSQGFSYIGAPWFAGFCEATSSAEMIGVGNSGFSLRRIQDCIRALLSCAYEDPPAAVLRKLNAKQAQPPLLRRVKNLLKSYMLGNNTFFLFNSSTKSEDRFWGDCVAKKYSWFKLASCEEAMRFSAEVNARKLVQENFNSLPFGCHAWWRYDFDFWKPHIEQQGYSL